MKNKLNKIKFEKVNCLFCHTKSKAKFLLKSIDRINNLPGTFYLRKCLKCGLVFQSPRPKEQYIKYFYPDNTLYFKPTVDNKSYFYQKFKKAILINYYRYSNLGKKNLLIKILIFPIYLYFFRHLLIPQYVKNGHLLEIGCSHGEWLEELKKNGFNTFGVELNRKAAQYGQKRRNLKIKINSVNNCDFKPNSFDVVIMGMVLEHNYHPDQLISKVTKWLKPDGQLIFSIPYFEGWEFRFYQNYAYGLHLPNHIYFLGQKQIKNLLSKNFKKIKFIFHHFDRDVVASAHYKYQDTWQSFYRILAYNKIIRYLLIKPFVFLLSLYRKTSRVTVRAIRK